MSHLYCSKLLSFSCTVNHGLQQCAHLVCPCVDCGLGRDEIGAAGGIKAELPFLYKRGTAAGGAHIAQDAAGPAAVRHKRDDRFTVPAVAVQNVFTAGAIVYHHVGVPTAMMS